MSEKKEEEKKDDDPRFEYILQYLTLSSKLKPEKWAKMMSTDEYKDTVTKFFDDPNEKMLTMQISPAGILVPSLSLQTGGKVKISYFMRKTPEKITPGNYRDVIIPGDMSPKPLEDLSVLFEEAYVPILLNPRNQVGWPAVASEDVEKHLHDFGNSIRQIRGKMSGQTLLPMPIGIERIFDVDFTSEQPVGDRSAYRMKSNIEEIVIKWSTQINEVLSEDNSRTDNNHPTPNLEVDFWRQRLRNLESIYDQMQDPRVKRMISLLETTESPYLPSFTNLFKNVVAGVVEARDICLYLKPLQPYFGEIESAEFSDIEPVLKKLLHCVCLAWANSRYYCTTTRIIKLISSIANLIIEQATKYLDVGSLFEGDINDNMIRLDQTLSTGENFRETFESFRDKVGTYFKAPTEPILWTFHQKLVFSRLIKFEERLKEIQQLFEIAEDYLKLEKVEISGLQGRKLSQMTSDIYDEFVKAYNEFSSVQYDILLPEDDHFTEDLNEFLTKVDEWDRRLATIFNKAFSECYNIDEVFRLTLIMGTIGLRPTILELLYDNYDSFMTMLHEYMDDVKLIFDKRMKSWRNEGTINIDVHFPPVAGALCFLIKLKVRIDYPMDSLKLIDHPVLNSERADILYEKYEELQNLLKNTEEEIFKEWAEKVPEICSSNLAKTLLVVNEDRTLALNFDRELSTLLQEIRYMIILNRTDLPQEAEDLFARTPFFFESVYNLNLIINWYNRIREHSSPVEMELVKEEIETIDQIIDNGQENYDWNSPEVPEYIETLLDLVKKLHLRIFRAQENIDKMLKTMYEWAMIPVLERKDLRDENLLAIGEREERFAKRYDEIKRTADEIARILDENYKLFFDLLPQSEYAKDEFELEEEREEKPKENPTEGAAEGEAPEGEEAK
ncbi:dynein beta chain, ciliary-like [Venturia canescens]|uniref:dynein beta chain, ciliary-like n=1 Tax=Venturia canescens TaxID=32260 RepID=UPI001C9BFD7A|nr:dynein beta chain, ciliary-like [Venturia canescens]